MEIGAHNNYYAHSYLYYSYFIYHQKNGNTPLHLAAKHDKATIVKYLLEQGADKSAKNDVRLIIHNLLTKLCSNTQHGI